MDCLGSAILNGILATVFMILFFIFFFTAIKVRTRLDRYRIKYGFDRELEAKDVDKRYDVTKTLDRRESNFKERVLRD